MIKRLTKYHVNKALGAYMVCSELEQRIGGNYAKSNRD